MIDFTNTYPRMTVYLMGVLMFLILLLFSCLIPLLLKMWNRISKSRESRWKRVEKKLEKKLEKKIDQEKRLNDSIDSQRTLTESCQNKAKELEARQNRLSAGVQDIEERMNGILSVSQKIDVMVEFFDMLDKDGFWEPIKIEMENENKRNGKQL